MATIPAIVYLLIGAGISYLSFRAGEELTIFFFVGLIFIGIGVAKFLIGRIFKTGVSKSVEKQLPKLHSHLRYCPKCRSPARKVDKFCTRCGIKLR